MPLTRLYHKVRDSVVQVLAVDGARPVSYGSGSVMDSGNIVLTCAHCVVSGTTPAVADPANPNRAIVGTILHLDPHVDIALLRFDQTVGSPVDFASSDTCSVGNGAFVVGFPMGVPEKTLVAAHIASITAQGLRIDASVNHGNSGGPLFDMDGKQIGVVNAKHGSLSEFLTSVQSSQSGAKMTIGGIDPVEAIQALIGEMKKNLNLGIGYAIKTSDIRHLHSLLESSIP